MPRSLRIGRVLIGVGAVVGVAAAAIGLLAAGAIVNRYAKQSEPPAMLDQGDMPVDEVRTRSRVREEP